MPGYEKARQLGWENRLRTLLTGLHLALLPSRRPVSRGARKVTDRPTVFLRGGARRVVDRPTDFCRTRVL